MGKHAKKKSRRSKLKTAGVVTGGLALPVAVPVSAEAATEEQWDAIAECESGGNWSINYSGDGMSVGGLQFQNASWQAALDYLNGQGYDTSAWTYDLYQGMPTSEVPDKYQTVLAAEALLHLQGPGAWVCTGIGLDASMFDGGPTPAILDAPTPAPDVPDVQPDRKVYEDHVHHTVQPGDTLYNIAKIYLGDGHKWGQVYNVPETREVVGDNPHLIYPGQDIRVNTTSEVVPKSEPSEPPDAADNMYVPPVDAPVGQVYGNPSSGYALGYHTGVDFSASTGTEVVSATGGKVVASDTSSAYGINVQVENADGTYCLYAHLSSAAVSPGDLVEAGQPVGYVGSTGASTGPHLHFEVRTVPEFGDGNFVDPLDWLRAHGVTI